MSRAALKRAALLSCALAALLAGSAGAALVEINNLVLHANGGFEPRALPRHKFAPIEFEGHVDIAAKDGGRPLALTQAVVDFDRDGRLAARGLPTCPPARVAEATTSEARKLCRGALVGTGRVEALISLPSGGVPTSAPLTLFNGPPLEGEPTVVMHTRITVPATQTFAILVPIHRRAGAFRYRAVLDVPPIAGGLGSITRIEIEVGRRFNAEGKHRSYVSARCTDGILDTHGRFTFEDGTIIDGSVEKFCRAH